MPTAVVFILDEAPQDSTIFLVQRDFLKGLLEEVYNYGSNSYSYFYSYSLIGISKESSSSALLLEMC